MRSLATTSLALLLAACGGGDTEPGIETPGRDERPETRVLDAGAALLQDKPPIDAINAYLDGFHFYSGRMESQMEAHHYCSVLNEDVIQCVIYDGNVREARIMGVEYIVGESLFAGLPEAEKALWHSHVHEVKSGQLVAPGLPQAAERELMEKLVRTYGKTWHTWHTDLDKDLPYGVPQLMMGFTADGQADPAMVAARDARLGVDSQQRRRDRAGIEAPPVQPGADAWQQGNAIQLEDPTGHVHAPRDREETGERDADAPQDADASQDNARSGAPPR
jgi:hypothetical protein